MLVLLVIISWFYL